MCEKKNSGGLIAGLALGAAIGAGVTFLFGTKKGKEIRENVRDQYPELFDRVEDLLGDVRENLEDTYDDVIDEVEKVKDEVSKKAVMAKVDKLGAAIGKISSRPKRFLKSGRKL